MDYGYNNHWRQLSLAMLNGRSQTQKNQHVCVIQSLQ